LCLRGEGLFRGMTQTIGDSALSRQPRSAPLGVTFAVIMAAGIASWAVVLTGLYFAWAAIRSFLT
jgi:hypothetical protein